MPYLCAVGESGSEVSHILEGISDKFIDDGVNPQSFRIDEDDDIEQLRLRPYNRPPGVPQKHICEPNHPRDATAAAAPANSDIVI